MLGVQAARAATERMIQGEKARSERTLIGSYLLILARRATVTQVQNPMDQIVAILGMRFRFWSSQAHLHQPESAGHFFEIFKSHSRLRYELALDLIITLTVQ